MRCRGAAQDALDLTRSLGGYVVSSSVATGEQGRVAHRPRPCRPGAGRDCWPLPGSGRIVSQQVTIDDLQQNLDELTHRQASVLGQIARIRCTARLRDARQLRPKQCSEPASASCAVSCARCGRASLDRGRGAHVDDPARRGHARCIRSRRADVAHRPHDRRGSRKSSPGKGVIALGLLIVLAPFALVAFAAWLGRRFYRRREEAAARDIAGVVRSSVAISASATIVSGRPENLTRLAEPRASASVQVRPSRCIRSLCPLDGLARGESLGERVRLLAQRAKLLVSRGRRRDRREQIGLPKRLHEVAEDARPRPPARRARCSPYAVTITIRIGRSSRMRRAASIPSRPGIFTSRSATSGSGLARERHGLLTVTGLRADPRSPRASSMLLRSSRMRVSSSAIEHSVHAGNTTSAREAAAFSSDSSPPEARRGRARGRSRARCLPARLRSRSRRRRSRARPSPFLLRERDATRARRRARARSEAAP